MGGSVLAAAHGSASLWYLTRGTAVTALILLSAVVVLGITTAQGWSSRRWPTFFSQALHRELSLLCLALIAVHVLTTIFDGFVPFGFLDAVVPFHSPSRALWQGLGALSFDLFLALGITSALRQRVGYRMWRVIHWLAYLCWPLAVFHGLGAGTDTRLEPVLVIDAVCVSAVLVTTGWRLGAGWRGHGGRRLLGGLGASVVTAALICFVVLGPLQSDRSRPAGTFSPTAAGFSSGAKGRDTAQIAQRTGTANRRGPGAPAPVPTRPSPGQSSQPASGPSGANSPNAGPSSSPPPTPAPRVARSCTADYPHNPTIVRREADVQLRALADLRADGHIAAEVAPRCGRGPLVSVTSTACPGRSSAPVGVSRLLAGLVPGGPRVNVAEHLDQWGPPPSSLGGSGPELLEQLERSGLRGRGGGWFPTAVKWRAVSSRRLRHPVVVANGAEGEPRSIKDRLLLGRVPHLVLDGASLAATAVGAGRLIVYVRPSQLGAVSTAVADRTHLGLDPVEPEVVVAADGFVAGESSAVVGYLNGGPGAVPTFTGLRPVHERGVSGRPTLVQNVETLAHVALIARFGAAWFRRLGTADSPGTALATLSVTGRRPGVVEMPVGTTLRGLIAMFGVPPSSLQAVLLGGYGGAWVSARQVMDVPLCEERLRPVGATLGAGVVALLPRGVCPLAETARIVRYMEGQGARQCGPCVNGLPAVTEAMTNLAFDRSRLRGTHLRLIELCDLIDGRGACHHPDGVARLVRSTLRTFASHLDLHQHRGPCSGAYRPGVLRIPDPDPRRPVARSYSV